MLIVMLDHVIERCAGATVPFPLDGLMKLKFAAPKIFAPEGIEPERSHSISVACSLSDGSSLASPVGFFPKARCQDASRATRHTPLVRKYQFRNCDPITRASLETALYRRSTLFSEQPIQRLRGLDAASDKRFPHFLARSEPVLVSANRPKPKRLGARAHEGQGRRPSSKRTMRPTRKQGNEQGQEQRRPARR